MPTRRYGDDGDRDIDGRASERVVVSGQRAADELDR